MDPVSTPPPWPLGAAADRLLASVRRHGGVVTRDQIDLEGHGPRTIQQLLHAGRLVRVARGIYRLSDYAPFGEAAFVAAAALIPRGVVTLLSALAQYGLTTQIPSSVYLAVPTQTNEFEGKIEIPITLVRVAPRFFKSDIFTVRTKSGGRYRIFAAERAVCEAFKFRRLVGEDVAYESLRNLLQRPFDRSRLIDTAKLTGTTKFVLPALKVLTA
jgi:Transcriptional regulator, AbiEi antitoxin